MLDIFAGVPPAEREKMLAIGRSMAAMSRKQVAAEAPFPALPGESAAIQARKDLTAIGLSYHDRNQFLDAVKRKDVIAVQLFLTGRGVDPNARDAFGNTALDLARRGGDPEIIALLSAAAPR
jgi:ankyrin repeat protein